MRNVSVIAVVGLCVFGAFARAETPFRYPEGHHGTGELRYIDDVPVLIVEGTHAEMGEQIGVLALKPAAKELQLVDGFVDRAIPAAVRPLANAAAYALYAQFPDEYRQELEAMATAAGVDKSSLVMANTVIDLQEMIGCASVLVAGNRSTTGSPLYGRNMDVPYVKGLAEYSLLIVYRPADGLAFAMPNLPGFLMLASGMNARGLALGSQSVDTPNDGSGRFDLTGIPSAVAGRRLMENCENIDSARRWLEQHPLARCVSIAACDRAEQCVLEVTTKRVLSRTVEEGLCFATNQFRCKELAGTGTCWRYARLEASRTQNRLGVDDVAKLMHATNQGKLTIHTMVFEPETLRLHLSMGPGPASARPLRTIELAQWLGGIKRQEAASTDGKRQEAASTWMAAFRGCDWRVD